MDKSWDEIMEGVDWDAVESEIEKTTQEENGRKELLDYFWEDGFDYKRGYIFAVMNAHPEIDDRYIIDAASEEMLMAHDFSVELAVDDALRLVKNDKPTPIPELVKMLNSAGITNDNVMDVIENAEIEHRQTFGGVKTSAATRKARSMTEAAELLSKNPDILLLGLPTFDPEQNWTQVKLAFFTDDLTAMEASTLTFLMKQADKHKLTVKNGVAIALFQIYNIWSDFN